MSKEVKELIKSIENMLAQQDVLQDIGAIEGTFEELEKTHPEGSTATFQSGPGKEARQHVKKEGQWIPVPQPPKEIRDTENVKLPGRKGKHHSQTL